MEPINYSIGGQANPLQNFAQNFQFANGLREAQLKQQQAQQEMAARQQMQQELADLSRNPTPQAVAAASVRYPQLSEQLKRSYDMLKPEQQRAKLEAAIPVHAAALSGRPEVAAKKLRESAAAMEATSPEEAKGMIAMAEKFEQDPAGAALYGSLYLAGVMGPEKYVETFGKLGDEGRKVALAPVELREAGAKAGAAESDAVIKAAQAGVAVPMAKAGADKAVADAAKAGSDATTAAVTAKYAEKNTIADLEAKGWNIKALQADIDYKRQASRIAAMNASIAREGNDLKRRELEIKVNEAENALADKMRTKVAEAESGAANIDNMLNTIERLKKNDSLDAILGSVAGRLSAGFAGSDGDDAEALIETLKSQAFLAQVPQMKSLGALSNAEGDKLQSALQNLRRAQSPKQFRENLDEAGRLVRKGRETLAIRTGVPIGNPDTPAAPGARPPLSSFFGR